MLTAKEARKLSKYKCENLSVNILIDNINKYIKSACDEKRIEMSYIVDETKYSFKTTKKAIKILKRKGYRVKAKRISSQTPNYPNHMELTIRWW